MTPTNFLRTLSTMALLSLLTGASMAQVSITSFGTPVTENFDGVGASATATLPTGWRAANGTSVDYAVAATATTHAAGSTGTGAFTTALTTVGIYNCANGVTASATDRAIGWVVNSDTTRNLFVHVQNNTGGTITDLNVTFDYERYRSSNFRTANMRMYHGASGSAWTDAGANGFQDYPVTGTTTVHNPPQTVSKNVTLTGLSIAPGASYYFSWRYTSAGITGVRHIVGVDNISITASGTLPNNPPTLSNDSHTPTMATTSALSFSVDAVDSDGFVGDVSLFWRQGVGGFFSHSMTLTSGVPANGTWSLDLAAAAALNDGEMVEYYFVGTDDDTDTDELHSSAAPATVYVNNRRPTAGDLQFNEVMYNPDDSTQAPDATGEWVEFYNPSTTNTYDISLFEFTDGQIGNSFIIPVGTMIGPEQHLLVIRDLAAFENVATWAASSTGAVKVAGFNFDLDGVTDSPTINNDDAPRSPIGFGYYEVGTNGWPTDVEGRSIERRSWLVSPAMGSNWYNDAVGNLEGSPGARNFAALPPTLTNGMPSVTLGSSVTGLELGDATDTIPNVLTPLLQGSAPAGVTVSNEVVTAGKLVADVAVDCSFVGATFDLTYRLTDGDGFFMEEIITFSTAANQDPTIGAYTNFGMQIDDTTTASPDAAPADPETNIASVAVSPGNFGGAGSVSVSNATTGEISLDATGAAEDTYTFTVTVTDNCGNEATSMFEVAVSQGPPLRLNNWMLLD